MPGPDHFCWCALFHNKNKRNCFEEPFQLVPRRQYFNFWTGTGRCQTGWWKAIFQQKIELFFKIITFALIVKAGHSSPHWNYCFWSSSENASFASQCKFKSSEAIQKIGILSIHQSIKMIILHIVWESIFHIGTEIIYFTLCFSLVEA